METRCDYYRLQMTDHEFSQLSSYIFNNLGIKMPEAKRIMLQSRLHKRLSTLEFESFQQYIDYIFSKEGESSELINMIDLVTTNKTDFFREPIHFEILRTKAIPDMMKADPSLKHFRIWSAGCSSGEEPYTIAMTMSDHQKEHGAPDYSILGTDLSTQILRTAQLAIYNESKVANVSLETKRKYLLKNSA